MSRSLGAFIDVEGLKEESYSLRTQPSQGTIKTAEMIEVDRRIVVDSGVEKVELVAGFEGLPMFEVLNELQSFSESTAKRGRRA